jgi:5,10-methylenetetrahydromethanopterin reductase
MEVIMPVPVQISLRIPGTVPTLDIARLVQEVEAAGFAGAGILDSQLLCRDVFVTMAVAAMQTSHITIFPAVTNPFTRHASVLAGAIQTVEELAPDRIKCIIGTGYTSASTIGRKPATLAQMRTCIMALKGLLAGQTVDFSGTPGRLQYAAGRQIPVLMAASGPEAIELAGEIADGALLMVGYTPGIVAAALEHLERGARRGGRRLDDLEIIWAVRTGTAATTSEAQRQARPIAVHWGILRWGAHWLEDAGLKLPQFEIPDAVWKIYPDLSHAADWEEAIAATSFVPDGVIAQLCDALGLVGTPEHCAKRIMGMAEVGVTQLYLMSFQTFVGPQQELAAFRDQVFPILKAQGYQ